MLQNSLRAAAEQHADPKRIGKLWHSHGVQYQNGFDYENAEDAYTRAIRLLRNSALKAEYADSLHSMAVIYLMQERLKEARSNDGQALAIFEELGQTRNAASVKGTVAMGLVREHRFQEAETEASAALAAMEARENPDRNDLENAYLTRARAIAGEGRPQAALEDVARARAIATGNPGSNTIDAIATLPAQGRCRCRPALRRRASSPWRRR